MGALGMAYPDGSRRGSGLDSFFGMMKPFLARCLTKVRASYIA